MADGAQQGFGVTQSRLQQQRDTEQDEVKRYDGAGSGG
jgi:hypothetical protein